MAGALSLWNIHRPTPWRHCSDEVEERGFGEEDAPVHDAKNQSNHGTSDRQATPQLLAQPAFVRRSRPIHFSFLGSVMRGKRRQSRIVVEPVPRHPLQSW